MGYGRSRENRTHTHNRFVQPLGDVIVSKRMVTKRQLGLIFILLGVGAAAGMFIIDLLQAGQYQGIGPAQQRALILAGISVLLGLTLLPLGDRPA